MKKSEPVHFVADFTALEKRAAAHLIAGVQDLLDLHKISAALMFGVPYSEVTREQRHTAKVETFRLAYTPDAEFSLPEEAAFKSIFTDEEWERLNTLPYSGYEMFKDMLKGDQA